MRLGASLTQQDNRTAQIVEARNACAPMAIQAATSRYEATMVAMPMYTNLRQTSLTAGPIFVTLPLAGLKELMRLPNRMVKPGSVAPAAEDVGHWGAAKASYSLAGTYGSDAHRPQTNASSAVLVTAVAICAAPDCTCGGRANAAEHDQGHVQTVGAPACDAE